MDDLETKKMKSRSQQRRLAIQEGFESISAYEMYKIVHDITWKEEEIALAKSICRQLDSYGYRA
jgi:hypothetical protein